MRKIKEHMPTKKMVLALVMIFIGVTMTFAPVALAHGGGQDGGDHSQGHAQGPATAGKEQASQSEKASHSDESPPWLVVAFAAANFVVLGGIVMVLRRS